MSRPAAPAGHPQRGGVGPPVRTRVFATAGVIAFLTAADTTVVAAAAPSAAADLGFGLAATQAVTAAYLVPFAGLLLTAGAVVDRAGERAALRAGLAAFAVGTVLAGLGSHLAVLLAGRAVQGAAAALLVPAAMGAIRTRLDPADRPRGAAVWTVSLAVALAGGPALGGLAAEHLHWSAVFWGFLPLLALGMAVLPPPAGASPPPAAPLDLPGGALLAAAMALLTGGLLVLADGGALAGPLCVAGLAVAGLTGLRRGSVLPRDLLADRVVRGAVAAQALWGVGVTGVSVVTPLVHQRDLGLGPAEAAVPLVAVAAALILTAPLTPRLCLRYGQAAVAAAGLVVVAVGLGAIAAVGHLPVLWPRLPGLVLVGVGSAGAVPLTTLALDAAGERAAGSVSGLLGTAREFAGAIGVALVAAVATSAAGYTAALAGAAVAQLAAALCVRTLCSPDKPPKETAHPTDKVAAGRKRR